MSYMLMRYDDAVCRFEMWHDLEDMDEPRQFVARIVELLPAAACALPVNMEPTDAGLTVWLARRTIPKNRANIISFLAKMRLDERDKVGILNVSLGLSLNDAFWIWNEKNGDPLRFDDINLYDNDFSDIVALMAFTGEGSVSDPHLLGSSPEYTTGGMLAKAWRRIGGRIYLYKTGTEGFVNAGFEPYSEYLAPQVARRMGLRAVDYRLEMWNDRLCSVCELFTSKDIAFVNAGSLIRSGGMKAVVAYYQTLGESSYQQLVSMLVFDGVIANQDRHFGNFGLLVGRNNSFVDTAPLFDQGVSLFAYAHGEDWDNLDQYLLDHRPATYESYTDFVKPYLGDEQRWQLERLSGFTFERHPLYGLPEWRYEKLEAFIASQAKKFLS